MKSVCEFKEEFKPLLPKWAGKVMQNKYIPLVFFSLLAILTVCSVTETNGLWVLIPALIMGAYVFLAFLAYGLLGIDYIRIRILGNKNNFTFQDWQNCM